MAAAIPWLPCIEIYTNDGLSSKYFENSLIESELSTTTQTSNKLEYVSIFEITLESGLYSTVHEPILIMPTHLFPPYN